MFPFVRAPDLRDPFAVWAQSNMYDYKGDVPVEEPTPEQQAGIDKCFRLAPQTDEEWWNQLYEKHVQQLTAPGPWKYNCRRPDWSKDDLPFLPEMEEISDTSEPEK